MKVYRKIIINMATGKIIKADSYEYSGPVCELKGGRQYVPPLPPPVKEEDPRVAQERERMRIKLKNMKGRRSTMLTGGMGVEEDPLLAKSTLLGGGTK